MREPPSEAYTFVLRSQDVRRRVLINGSNIIQFTLPFQSSLPNVQRFRLSIHYKRDPTNFNINNIIVPRLVFDGTSSGNVYSQDGSNSIIATTAQVTGVNDNPVRITDNTTIDDGNLRFNVTIQRPTGDTIVVYSERLQGTTVPTAPYICYLKFVPIHETNVHTPPPPEPLPSYPMD